VRGGRDHLPYPDLEVIMATFEDYPDLLTAKEAAELLRVHIRTLHRMVKRGDLKVYRLSGGRDFRIKKSDLLSALERVEPMEKRG